MPIEFQPRVILPNPVMPDFSRVSPFAGFGRLFAKEHVTDIIKLVVISSVVVSVGGSFLLNSVSEISTLVLQPSTIALKHLMEWLTTGLGSMLLVIAAVAAIDVPLQMFLHKFRHGNTINI